MEKEKLAQYLDLKKEIDDLDRRLQRERVVRDTVRASSVEFPYTEYVFTVEGYTDTRRILEERKRRAERLKREIERFILEIPDARTRRICEWRYIHGKSWADVTRKIGCYSENYAKKIHDRYLEKTS